MKSKREIRAAAKARGLCGVCCCREPSGDNVTCDVCIGRSHPGKTPDGAWCLNCIAFGFHRAECR